MWIFIAASQLASPQAIGFESWFSDDDYPSSQTSSRETAFRTVTQTLVDANGKIVGCRIETPSSDPQIDARACAIILKRGKFEPARWSDGAPVPGVYRTSVSFILFGDSLAPAGDIEIDVAKLPDDKKSPVFVTVAFASDAQSRIVDCADEPLSKHAKRTSPALVALACETVIKGWKPFAVTGDDGKPSRSVQNATVMFTLPAKDRH